MSTAILYINWAQAAYERLITNFSSHPALPGALYRVADEYQVLQRHEQARQIYQYIVGNLPESHNRHRGDGLARFYQEK